MNESVPNYPTEEILSGLTRLLEISTKKPEKRIDSPMVATGQVEDSWYRKGKFSTALTYMEMLVFSGAIQDEKLKTRIVAFREMQMAEDFNHSSDTTPQQVKIAYQLVQDVVDYISDK